MKKQISLSAIIIEALNLGTIGELEDMQDYLFDEIEATPLDQVEIEHHDRNYAEAIVMLINVLWHHTYFQHPDITSSLLRLAILAEPEGLLKPKLDTAIHRIISLTAKRNSFAGGFDLILDRGLIYLAAKKVTSVSLNELTFIESKIRERKDTISQYDVLLGQVLINLRQLGDKDANAMLAHVLEHAPEQQKQQLEMRIEDLTDATPVAYLN